MRRRKRSETEGGTIGERGEEEKVNTMAPEPKGGQFNNKHFEREEVNVMVDAHLEKRTSLARVGPDDTR